MNRMLILAMMTCLVGVILLSASSSFTQETSPSTGEPNSDIGVRYANACLHLAQIEVRNAREMNLKSPNKSLVVSQLRMTRLESNVEVAKRQLEIANRYQHGSTMPLQRAYAEAAAELAKKDVESARKTRRNYPQAMAKPKLERLEARAEVARLRAEMWRDGSYLPSLVDQMQWQIDRLTEEIIELNQRVAELGDGS